MLSVTNKPIMLNIVMLSVVWLSVVMLSVVAPIGCLKKKNSMSPRFDLINYFSFVIYSVRE
jgi:hypothetical protein